MTILLCLSWQRTLVGCRLLEQRIKRRVGYGKGSPPKVATAYYVYYVEGTEEDGPIFNFEKQLLPHE